MTGCGAALFLRAGGPAAVPLRACCAAALLRAAAGPAQGGPGRAAPSPAEVRPAPFVCRAAEPPVLAPGVAAESRR
jgi:hypothetical protein